MAHTEVPRKGGGRGEAESEVPRLLNTRSFRCRNNSPQPQTGHPIPVQSPRGGGGNHSEGPQGPGAPVGNAHERRGGAREKAKGERREGRLEA